MNPEPKLLQVGDVVIEYYYYGGARLHTITSVTTARCKAESTNQQFVREISVHKYSEGQVKPYPAERGWQQSTYKLGTPELLEEMRQKKHLSDLVQRMKTTDFGKLPVETLEAIANLLPEKK